MPINPFQDYEQKVREICIKHQVEMRRLNDMIGVLQIHGFPPGNPTLQLLKALTEFTEFCQMKYYTRKIGGS